MKIVNYVHNMADYPEKYADESVGIYKDEKGPITGEMLGFIKYKDKNYLVGRTILAFGDDPNYIGKITARHAFIKMNYEEAGNLYIDINEDEDTDELVQKLRNIEERDKIKLTEQTLKEIAETENFEIEDYDSVSFKDELVAIAIRHERFDYLSMEAEFDKNEKEESSTKQY